MPRRPRLVVLAITISARRHHRMISVQRAPIRVNACLSQATTRVTPRVPVDANWISSGLLPVRLCMALGLLLQCVHQSTVPRPEHLSMRTIDVCDHGTSTRKNRRKRSGNGTVAMKQHARRQHDQYDHRSASSRTVQGAALVSPARARCAETEIDQTTPPPRPVQTPCRLL